MSHGGEAVQIGLPTAVAGERVVQTGDVTAFGGDGNLAAVIDETPGGVRIATVDADPNGGSQRYRYPVTLPDGASMTVVPGGGVAIEDADGNALAAIATPWARDSLGASLPTHYDIEGTMLVQVVDTSNAVGVVIADPHLDWGWGTLTIYFNKSTSRWIGNAQGWALAGFLGGITMNPWVLAGASALASLNGDVVDSLAGRGYCLVVKFKAWSPTHPEERFQRTGWCT